MDLFSSLVILVGLSGYPECSSTANRRRTHIARLYSKMWFLGINTIPTPFSVSHYVVDESRVTMTRFMQWLIASLKGGLCILYWWSAAPCSEVFDLCAKFRLAVTYYLVPVRALLAYASSNKLSRLLIKCRYSRRVSAHQMSIHGVEFSDNEFLER